MFHSPAPSFLKRAAAVGIGAVAARSVVSHLRAVDLDGKVVLITGGSRGLGLELARQLGSQGCKLALCARTEDELQRATDELRTAGYDVFSEPCDVSDQHAVDTFVRRVEAHYGKIDLLVANASEIQVGPVEALSAADFERIMSINFFGALYPILAALPGMRARKEGRIAVITSIGGRIATPHLLPYSTAKFATVGLSEGLAAELRGDGITVTTVVPGLLRTGSHVQARFTGGTEQREADFRWFAAGASSPTSPPADKAASIVIDAIRRGKREVTFPWGFAVVSRLHGVAPATTVRVMEIVEAFLPDRPPAPGEQPTTERGEPIEDRNDSTAVHLITTLGRDAEEDFNQT